jgi:hypothetical protein
MTQRNSKSQFTLSSVLTSALLLMFLLSTPARAETESLQSLFPETNQGLLLPPYLSIM